MSRCSSQQRALGEFGADLDRLSRSFGAAEHRRGVAAGDIGGDRAGLAHGDAAQGVRRRKGSQVRGRRCPACQDGGLGQQEHDRHGRDDHKAKSCSQDCT